MNNDVISKEILDCIVTIQKHINNFKIAKKRTPAMITTLINLDYSTISDEERLYTHHNARALSYNLFDNRIELGRSYARLYNCLDPSFEIPKSLPIKMITDLTFTQYFESSTTNKVHTLLEENGVNPKDIALICPDFQPEIDIDQELTTERFGTINEVKHRVVKQIIKTLYENKQPPFDKKSITNLLKNTYPLHTAIVFKIDLSNFLNWRPKIKDTEGYALQEVLKHLNFEKQYELVNAVDDHTISPLLFALDKRMLNAARILIDHGANILFFDAYENTIFHHLFDLEPESDDEKQEFLTLLQTLVNNPNAIKIINHRNIRGITPLSKLVKTLWYSESLLLNAATLLIKNGGAPSINMSNNNGSLKPLWLASVDQRDQNHANKLLALLLQYGGLKSIHEKMPCTIIQQYSRNMFYAKKTEFKTRHSYHYENAGYYAAISKNLWQVKLYIYCGARINTMFDDYTRPNNSDILELLNDQEHIKSYCTEEELEEFRKIKLKGISELLKLESAQDTDKFFQAFKRGLFLNNKDAIQIKFTENF